MRKLCFIISAVICIPLFFNNITAFAEGEDKILTLEEAKTLALKNDVHYNLQENYIKQAKEDYNEACDTHLGKYSNIVEKTTAEISQNVAITNAESNVRKAVLNKANLKRTSDYEVTNYYYAAIEAQNSISDAEADMYSKKQDLEKARIKYMLDIIPKASLSQAETAYTASMTAYNKAVSERENSILKLEKSIVGELDLTGYQLDTTISIPDISSIDLTKTKEDYLKNNTGYFSVKEQYDVAEYKLTMTKEKYDYYHEEMKNMSDTICEKFDTMLYDAQKEFDDVEYSYGEKLDELDESLDGKYSSLKDLYESYEDQKDEIGDAKLSIEENRIKYQMGIINKAALDESITNLDSLENQLYSTKVKINEQYMDLTQYSLDE